MLIGTGAAVSFAATRTWTSPQVRLARMSGSSVAAPDAAGWVTDFRNAACYRRRPELRDVEDLRLAFAVVTAYWHRRGHRRLRTVDVAPFHRAFARQRFVDGARTPRGTLDHLQLLALSRPETWPDYASEIGRFTPVRAGGLEGQTFEIEVAAGIAAMLHQIARRVAAGGRR